MKQSRCTIQVGGCAEITFFLVIFSDDFQLRIKNEAMAVKVFSC